MRLCALIISLLALTHGHAACAGQEEDDSNGREIIVTADAEGHQSAHTSTGTKTKTQILDIPQAITVVTTAQMKDQSIQTIADLARLLPGISAGQGEGHRDQINLRGNNSTADFFVDGLRDDAQYFRSFYNVERVEALKGPNAMIFGRGGGGGVINRVTKTTLDRRLLEGSASGSSFGAWAVTGDANIPFANGAVRVNGFYEALASHRDFYSGRRLGINPVVGLRLARWSFQLGYELIKDNRIVDRGIPSAFAGTSAQPAEPAPRLRDQFFGAPGLNRASVRGHVVTFHSSAELTDELTFSTQLLYGHYDKVYANAFAATAMGGTIAAPTVGIEAYREPTVRTNFIGQANVEWRGKAFELEHVVLVGAELTHQSSRSERVTGFFNATTLTAANRRASVALGNPLLVPALFFVAGPQGNGNRAVTGDLSQISTYLQDQITLGQGFELIGGVRLDRFKNAIINRFTSAEVARVDKLWSPRLGLVFKPKANASLYLSISKSYLPQSGDQFLAFDPNNANLAPETFSNVEVGAKWDIQPNLSATLAIYRLDRTNMRAAGATTGSVVQTGQQRSKGIEFGVTGKVASGWHMTLGYALTDARVIETTSAAPAGRKVGQVPRHQLSLWNKVDLSKNLSLGVDAYHQSKSFATISNVTLLPAYTRLDGALFLKISRGLNLQLNLENVTGARYFPTAHNDNNITPGAPFNARITVNVAY
jgi:catecholate siderophore receptor